MKILWTLYAAFFRIGLFTFGGGYAMLPMLQREVVERYGWSNKEELLDYFAIGQCTPGIIAVNTATLVGYKQKGVLGALFATLGIVSPSLVIIMSVAALLQSFAHYPAVGHAFAGIRVAVCALIASSVVGLFRSSVLVKPSSEAGKDAGGTAGDVDAGGAKVNKKDTPAAFIKRNAVPLLLCVAAFCVVALLGASPVFVVLGAAVAGLLLYGRRSA